MDKPDLQNLYTLARRAKDTGDKTAAAQYYGQILLHDPNSYEAVFYAGYFRAATCVIGDIANAANQLKSAFLTTASLIDSSNVENKESILEIYSKEACALLCVLSRAAEIHRQNHLGTNGIGQETLEWKYSCSKATLCISDHLYERGNKSAAAECYINAIGCWDGNRSNQTVLNRIRECKPDFTPPQPAKSGGCYVATAVYGSYDCPQVWTLRRYRDNTLAETWYGHAFIRTYYAISPTLVKWFGDAQWFKNLWKGKLDRMVDKLQADGVESTPYEDKNW